MKRYDAVIIGSGPNGLTAAITLARAGRSTIIYEEQLHYGGGLHSAELTLPGYIHDACSAVHPLAQTSLVFQSIPLEQYGLKWIQPPIPVAHPLEDGTAAALNRSVEETSESLGADAKAYLKTFRTNAAEWSRLSREIFAPPHLPCLSLPLLKFGMVAIRRAAKFARSRFTTEAARSLFAGLSAHSLLPLNACGTAGFGLVMGASAHAAGWPIAEGGSGKIADALAGYYKSLGGEIVLGSGINRLDQLPETRAILCDMTPIQLLSLAGEELSAGDRSRLGNFRYGPGVFKVDWALDGPVPWSNSELLKAGTIHLGGGFEKICDSEESAWTGRTTDSPFILFSQPTLFDPSRAPAGKHIAWAYCHVPSSCQRDMTPIIEAHIEKLAPGFITRILKRSMHPPAKMGLHNSNLIGGDIGGGSNELSQLFFRPTWRLYRTSRRGLYLCSSSTPPGGGVHGLCGYFSAQTVLRDLGD